ncbi:MAG: GGDEF domain-containing protein [Cellulomonadaceae bacterium]
MTLDLPTLIFISSLLSVTVSVLYLLQVSRRDQFAEVDRSWALTFFCVILATFCYGATELAGHSWWWAHPFGDALLVFAMGALWSGVRAYSGLPARLWLPLLTAAATAATGLVAGSAAGSWGSVWAYVPGVILWTALATRLIIVGPLRTRPGGTTLAAATAVWCAFYVARLVIVILAGAGSAVFDRYVGSGISSVVNLVLIVTGAFAIITMRSGEALTEIVKTFRFDPYLGTRTPENFRERGQALLDRHRGEDPSAALVLVEMRELPAITDAYGRPAGERAIALVARCLHHDAPRESMVGSVDGARSRFAVILSYADEVDARAWVRSLREQLRATPLVVDGDNLHLSVRTAVGVGSDDLGTLLAHAAEEMRLAEHQDAGGS